MVESKPNSEDTYVLSSLPNGGYEERTGNYKDSFIATYNEKGKLVELAEQKFDASKPFNEIKTKLVLDENGNFTNKGTSENLMDEVDKVMQMVKNESESAQEKLRPLISDLMDSLNKMFKNS